jgi:hypothetical protein
VRETRLDAPVVLFLAGASNEVALAPLKRLPGERFEGQNQM